MRALGSCAALLALALLAARPVAAEVPRGLEDVGIDQRLNEKVPLDLHFRDETGSDVRLGSYFGDKPVILALVYYQCPMLCTLVLNGLVSSLRALSLDAGKDFQVVVVSFDPTETPDLAAAKKATYLEEYRREGAEKGWHFLTGDEKAIRRLTQAVGFRYHYDPTIDQFAHATAITVLTPRGVIARYFYGVEYAPRDVRLGLVEAAHETIGSPVDQLLLFCFHYDVTTGRYSAAVLNLIRLGGVITLLALGGFIFLSRRRDVGAPV